MLITQQEKTRLVISCWRKSKLEAFSQELVDNKLEYWIYVQFCYVPARQTITSTTVSNSNRIKEYVCLFSDWSTKLQWLKESNIKYSDWSNNVRLIMMWFSHTKKCIITIQILKMTSPSSPLLKKFSIYKYGNVSCFAVKSIFCVCELEASSFHITFVNWVN